MNHPKVALSEIADLIRGITYKPSDICDETTTSAVACMRTKNVQEVLDESDIVWIPKELIRNSSKLLKPGDILVSSANSWNLVGKGCWVPELKYPASAGGFISILRGKSDVVDFRYLYHWLTSPRTQRKLRSYSNKTTNISNLDHSRTLATKISLPPLEEQQRIAAILDKASSVMKRTDTRLQTFKTFENSLFNHFFGRALEQQTRWDYIPFGELCHRLTVGVVVKPASYYRETGIPALRSLNVRPGSIEQSNFVYISEEDNNNALSKSKLSAGDLVFVRSGRPGTCAVIPQDLDGCNAIDLLLATSDTSKIMAEFAASYFNSIAGKALVSSESKGQVQQHFNAGSLKTSLIPVPPIELQEEFCKALSKTKALLGNHKVSLQRLEEIFRSLQQTFLLG